MKKKICFIVNPISGVGRQKGIETLAAGRLDRSRFEPLILYTERPKHATELSRNAIRNGCEIVVAVGGDGSVNEVGRGLTGTGTALAILPAGSGNGLARHIGIPMNLGRAIDVINSGKEIAIDTVKINHEIFFGMAGVGFDAHIGREFSKFGRRGFRSYLKVITREFHRYKADDYELEIDGRRYERHALMISFANGSQYGSNAVIAPEADLRDGMIDVCIVKDFPVYALPALAYRLFNRNLDGSEYLEIIRGKKVRVRQSGTIAHIDGEPVELGHEIHLEVIPLSLKVITP